MGDAAVFVELQQAAASECHFQSQNRLGRQMQMPGGFRPSSLIACQRTLWQRSLLSGVPGLMAVPAGLQALLAAAGNLTSSGNACATCQCGPAHQSCNSVLIARQGSSRDETGLWEGWVSSGRLLVWWGAPPPTKPEAAKAVAVFIWSSCVR
jgi:hypothetical protein